jgi:hypothetical protein
MIGLWKQFQHQGLSFTLISAVGKNNQALRRKIICKIKFPIGQT